jgi:ADP-ribose pyrophosphatase YjhB (NUDIX family)
VTPDWLGLVKAAQAIAQTGLTYAPPGYDRDRYAALQGIAACMMAALGGGAPASVAGLFAAQSGYATPKVDVRGAVFRDGRRLLVREVADAGRWTLPGGWADTGLTPAENVAREVVEESGFEVAVERLVAVWDRTRSGHSRQPFEAYKLFFLCRVTGGAARTSEETSEVGFFAESALPADLSHDRVLPWQLARMFAHAREVLAVDFN